MSFAVALALTAVSGYFYGLSFPTASIPLVAWVALVPFLLALRHASVGRALLLGWMWTIVAAYTLGDWFARSVATYYEQPIIVGIGFFIGVSSFMAAPFYMAFAACYRVLARRPGSLLSLLTAAAWAAAELGRARLCGNPWALFGYSQMGSDRLVQIADVTGVYGVSFVLVAVNAALAELWVERQRAGRALAGIAVAGGVVALVLAYGSIRLGAAPNVSDVEARPIKVAMIQGNLDVGAQWREEFYGRNLDVYLDLTSRALAESRPDLVFWPEGALTFFLEDEPLYRGAISDVLAPFGTQLVVGGPRAVGTSDPLYYNSIFLLSPQGTILASYDKQRLVPFAERFPFRGFDLLRRRFARVREFAPGAPRPPLPTVAGLAGITICNEAMFPEVAAARVREGAAFFVDPANDTWLTPKFSAQQFDIVRLRTVEQRRYLVRASTAGPSAIVDPFGRVVARTAFETRTAIAGTVWPRSGVTPYGRMGDAFALGCGLVALAAWVGRSHATVATARPARDDRPTDAQPALDRPVAAAIEAVRPAGASGPTGLATDWRET